jgi:hypothetical protein
MSLTHMKHMTDRVATSNKIWWDRSVALEKDRNEMQGSGTSPSDAPRRPEPQNLSTAPFLRLENSTTGRRRRRAAARVSDIGELEPSSSFDEEAASASHLLPRAPRTRVGESAISRGRERSLDPWWRCRRSRTRSIWWCCFATEGG